MDEEGLAIEAALKGQWDKAISLNLKILRENPQDIEVLNRLTYAYLQKGDCRRAKTICRKVISLNPYNPIALRNFKKLKDAAGIKKNGESISPAAFLEEPGKTKIVELVNIAPKKILANLNFGQPVFLKIKRHGVEVRDSQTNYLGVLPDDLSFRLKKLINEGNDYTACIKGLSPQLLVLIKETKRAGRLQDQPSFPSKLQSFPPSLTPDEDW